MSESKHTEGPWEITSISQDTGNIGIGHRDLRIVIAEVTNAASFAEMLTAAMRRGGGSLRQDDCSTQFANARLISAAPDLLAALTECAAGAGFQYMTFEARARVEAAIAKATGGTNA